MRETCVPDWTCASATPGVAVAAITILRAGLIAGLLALAGCAAQEGDFDRPVKNYVNDTMLPAIGDRMARARGEPVSNFMLTDDEQELRRRAYRMIMPIHRGAFFARNETEWVRTRIWPDSMWRPDPELYLDMLRDDGFVSSEARWNAVITAIVTDIPLVPPFGQVWQRVCLADLSRMSALPQTALLTPAEARDAEARVFENKRVAVWGLSAMRWRVESYAYAIQRSRLEIPSAKDVNADLALNRLRATVDELERLLSTPNCGTAPVPAVLGPEDRPIYKG